MPISDVKFPAVTGTHDDVAAEYAALEFTAHVRTAVCDAVDLSVDFC